MYRHNSQMHFFDYTLADVFELDVKNRWVKRAKMVPWEMAEERYSQMFRKVGRPAKDIRMALGALLIKEYLGCSDEETVQSIAEQPYLQHFIGLKKFTNKPPFDSSLMVWFRKRLSAGFMAELNEAICKTEAKMAEEAIPSDDDHEGHNGTLIVDATCAPADIKYPTDTALLADAIEKTDMMIDTMQNSLRGTSPRPRTYREKSRKMFSGFIKRRRPGAKTIRTIKKKQLGYLKRNLGYVHKMLEQGGKLKLSQSELLSVIERLFAQQQSMYDKRANRVDDRIVSLSQPHIRPIVRGKAGTPVEFGAKVNVSVVGGYVFPEEISYDAFHEGGRLKEVISSYLRRFGVLPSKILADQAFSSRENRSLCKELGIKLMGKPLGRPPKGTQPAISDEDTGNRNEVEGKFGTLKTRYSWNRIMARLPDTGKTVIAVAIMAMNLAKRANALLCLFLNRWFSCTFSLAGTGWQKVRFIQ